MSLYAIAFEMLQSTKPYSASAETLFFCNEDGYTVSLCEKISEVLEKIKEDTDGSRGRERNLQICYDVIAEKMAEYLRLYPAPYSFLKEKRVEFGHWLEKIAEVYGIRTHMVPAFFTLRQEEQDPALMLVKELHSSEGKSKDEISRDIGMARRAVQKNLRRLDIEWADAGERGMPGENLPFYIGGQPVRTTVTVRNGWPPRYLTEDPLSPIILQENLSGTVELMQALALRCEVSRDPSSCIRIAMDIWSQLSDFVKEQVRQIFAESEPQLQDFLHLVDLPEPGNQISVRVNNKNCFPESGNDSEKSQENEIILMN